MNIVVENIERIQLSKAIYHKPIIERVNIVKSYALSSLSTKTDLVDFEKGEYPYYEDKLDY